jgi:transcriptional regulator of arginine metabolism
MTKTYRQAQIQKLLRSRSVTTQQDLVRHLKSAGIRASQVTLSRDLRDLGIVKTPDGYKERSALQTSAASGDTLQRILGEFARDIQAAGNLVVVKTLPGSAGTVAEALDIEPGLGIVGTIAGDNTIFAATVDPSAAKRLVSKLTTAWKA